MRRLLATVLLLLLCVPVPARAAWQRTGQTPSGAVYAIAVPDGWRSGDGLVVYQHGLRFEPDLAPDLGPLASQQLAAGLAVAASGYRHSGWAAFVAAQDNRELVERFRVDIGEPGRVYTYGSAMGGFLALQMAQDPALSVAGVLALCPPAAADRHFEAALDLHLAFEAICVEAAARPAGTDLAWLPRRAEVSPAGLAALVQDVDRCTGIGAAPALRSGDQRLRLQRLQSAAGIADADDLLLALGQASLGLADLLRDPGKLDGRAAIGNAHVDYGEALLDAQVRRIAVDGFAALDLRVRGGLAGDGRARVVTLHGGADPWVASGHQRWLRERWPAARLAGALVADEAGSHCPFHAGEALAAWQALVDWVEGAPRPDAVELQARCLALADADPAAGPCRIDPARDAPPLDTQVRPRNEPVQGPDARYSGLWSDPAHAGERWLLELLDADTALLYGFTFPAGGEAGHQRWLIGRGRILGNGIVFADVHGMRGGRFGAAFAAGQARFEPWGEARLVFDACGEARLRFAGPAGYGQGERRLRQQLHLGGQDCGRDAVARVDGPGAFSGSYFDPAAPGQGLTVQVGADGRAVLGFLGYEDASGEPLWLQGDGRIDASGALRLRDVVRPHGVRFAAHATATLVRERWGEIDLDFADCDTAVLRYRGEDGARGELPLRRLTRPLGLGDCGLGR